MIHSSSHFALKIKKTLVVGLLCALFLPIGADVFDAHIRVAQAADEAMAIDVLGTATESSSDDLLSGIFFTFDSNLGQDMYKTIHKRVKSQGSNIAITKTTARRNLSKEELYAIIPGSNIGEILANPDPLAPLRDDQVRSRREDLIAELTDEKDLGDFEALTNMEVESTELYSNGDESDSGFDLIVDLEVIESILFNKEIQSMSGRDGSHNSGRDTGTVETEQQAEAPQDNGEQDDANNSDGAVQTPQPGAQEPVSAAQVDCPTDSSFNAAAERERGQDRASGAPLRDENGDLPSDGNADENNDDEDADEKEITPAPADDWHRELPCGDVFCLKIQKVYKTESSFTVSDNCVACHIQKINDSFSKLLSHNLVPNKVTGNLLEGPKCKDALYQANWLTSNIIVLGQPILTPPNDDLIIKADLFANMKLFWQRYVDSPKKCEGGEACRINPAELVLSQSKPGATFDDTTTTLAQEDRAIKEQKMREYRQDQLKRAAESQAGQYRVIMQEMSTMNDYFDNFSKLFDQLSNDPEASPCGVLANKAYCE